MFTKNRPNQSIERMAAGGRRLALGHIRTPMTTIIVCLLGCLSAFAGDTNEIHVVTRTATKVSPGYLVTYDEFTRNGQTEVDPKVQTTGRIL